MRGLLAVVDSGRVAGLRKMTKSSCIMEPMLDQRIPSPLINLTARNVRAQWEAEGFREI